MAQNKPLVGIAAGHFLPYIGGLETYSLNLARWLKIKGLTPVVITCNTEKSLDEEIIDGFRVLRLECWHLLGNTMPLPKFSLKNRIMLRKFFENSPSAIITQTRFFPLCFWLAKLAKKYNVRQIHIEHGSTHTSVKNPLMTFLFHLYDHTIGRYVVKSSGANIVISKQGRLLVEHLGGKPATYIPNSINPNDFSIINPKTSDKLQIIFLGRLIEQKGVQDLIEAFKKIAKPNWRLLIAGAGPYKEKLFRLTENDKRIIFAGELNQNEVKKELAKSTIFVNPSFLEGLPTSVLEAIASKVVVIATNVGGTPEIIKNGVNGYLIPPGKPGLIAQKIQDLANNPKLRKKFIQNASKILSQFDWSENIKKITKIIAEK